MANENTNDGDLLEVEPKPDENLPPPDDDDDGTSEEGGDGGEGGDPVKALRQERGKRKEARKQVEALKSKVAELEPLVAEYRNILPILPELIRRAKAAGTGGGGGAPPPVNQQDVAELTEIATDFGFETDDGKPDLERARKARDRMTRLTRGEVAAGTADVRRGSATALANQVRERAYRATDADGNLFAKREAIDEVFAQLPPEALADPHTATMALLVARGLKGPGSAAESEPVFTDGGGQTPEKSVAPLTAMEKAVAKIRGKSEKDWQKMTPRMPDLAPEGGWELEG